MQRTPLDHLAPEFVPGQGQQAQVASGDGAGRWAQWWEQITRYVRIDFNASERVQPLLAGQSLTQVRLALGLALEQAQWAALNGATEVYQQAEGPPEICVPLLPHGLRRAEVRTLRCGSQP